MFRPFGEIATAKTTGADGGDTTRTPLNYAPRVGYAIKSSVRSRAMRTNASAPLWQSIAVLAGRLIFAAVFIMALSFKLRGMDATAGYIASAGFPAPLLLAWLAAAFECVLSICFLTGAFFSQAALLAAVYVLFLAFAFHGPAQWAANQSEFGFFVDHFTFFAGLLFAAVNGPGRILALRRR
jgi:putative oxidoreductase